MDPMIKAILETISRSTIYNYLTIAWIYNKVGSIDKVILIVNHCTNNPSLSITHITDAMVANDGKIVIP